MDRCGTRRGRAFGRTIAAAALGLLPLQGCEVVSVTVVDATEVVVTPPEGSLHQGDTLRLRVELLDSQGNSLDERPIAWSTEDEEIAAVNPDGVVEARGVGETRIRVVSGRAEGSARITVTERPASRVASIEYHTVGGFRHDRDLRVTVEVMDHAGQPVAGATVQVLLTNVDRNSSWDRAAATGSDGRVVLGLSRHRSGCYETEVVRVTASGLPWDGETPKNEYCTG